MPSPALLARLAGPFPVLPTPMHDDESLDLDGLGEIVGRLLDRGVSGMTLLGSSGESAYLSDDEACAVVRAAVDRIEGRATTIAGIIRWGTREAVGLGKRLRDAGADVLMVALPQYYDTPFAEVVAHYGAIVRDVGLPVLYYHYPKPTHLKLSPERIGKLFAEVDLAGIKNSSVDTSDTLAQMREVGRPIRMFTGQSFDLLACLDGGAVGCICPVAAVMPVTVRKLVEAQRSGDRAAAQAAEGRIFQSLPLVMPEPGEDGPVGVPHAGIKEALVSMGILKSARIRRPQPGLSEARRAQVRAIAASLIEI